MNAAKSKYAQEESKQTETAGGRDRHTVARQGAGNRCIIRLAIGIYIFLLSQLFFTATASGADIAGDMDYSNIQKVIDDIMNQKDTIDFGEYVGSLMSGKETFSFTDIAGKAMQSVKGELMSNLSTFGRLLSIALIAALFTNLSSAFKNSQVSETGYYVAYLLLFALLITSFAAASADASKAIGGILDFMKALVPAYSLSVGFCTGSISSMAFYEAALVIISIVDLIIVKIVIPMINIYLIVMLVNNLSREDMLSRLAGLFETLIKWLLKTLLAAVVGFQAIQGMIFPVADKVKRSALFKASEAIPGIGNSIGSVTETVIGAGVLLKNSIGAAGLVVIISICTVPFLNLAAVTLIYKCAGAALQPVSDKRVTECIMASARSGQMLLQSMFTGAVLFLLSITIIAVSTRGAG